MITKESIKQANDRAREWVPLPEWAEAGTDPAAAGLWVGTMTARQQDHYDRVCAEMRDPEREEEEADVEDDCVRALLAVYTCQHEDGTLFFENEDRPWLAEKGGPPLSRILDAAVRINQMRKIDREAIAKNSKGPTSSSSTA